MDLRSIRDIARELGCPICCTVTRELGGKPRKGRGRYLAHIARERSFNQRCKQGRRSRFEHLPRRHNRRAIKGFRKSQKLERSASLSSIEACPREVDKRKVFGRGEGDTMVSRKSKERVKGINERVSGVVFFGKITDRQVAKVEYLLNTRSRKRLAGFTPYEVFYQIIGVALDC